MKHFLCLWVFLVGVTDVFSQTAILNVGAEEQLYIPAESVLYLEGLVHEPSKDVIIENNSLVKDQKVSNPLESAQPISYQWSSLIKNYSGNVYIFYEDLDLDIEEQSSLVMYYFNDRWIPNKEYIKNSGNKILKRNFINASFLEFGLLISEDPDFDGFSTQEEKYCGSDPYDFYSIPLDSDSDGTPDCTDMDDDNDGCSDTIDPYPLDPSECADSDGDGVGDNEDLDDDNDGVLDVIDNCLFTPNENQLDTDQDGIGDICDNDKDNDGMSDEQEITCGTDPLDSLDTPLDNDGDTIPDCIDLDDDNDGYEDNQDAFPLDEMEWLDTDNDGVGNNEDLDDDNDGFTDDQEINCECSCASGSKSVDGTTYSDPLDPNIVPLDSDGDGQPDCSDTDNDNDGVNDINDAFPLYSNEWTDTDLDGIGNNSDQDDDNDGYSDLDELECNSDPLNVNDLPQDLDQDGIPDCKDTDIDGDGCINTQDVFPRDPSECEDTDGDGLGNNIDVDDDNDGVIDLDDAFPLDPNETRDSDYDGIGDNADPDDNNDGFEDTKILVSGLLTPNINGMENTWKIINIDKYPYARVSVYNKNGMKVFSSMNYKNNWKGTNQKTNTQLSEGSYLYRLVLGDGSPAIEGWIYIKY